MYVWSRLGREKQLAEVQVIVTADRAQKFFKFLLVKLDRAVRLWRSAPGVDVCWVAHR
jgi:hypothetical protein